ncbi:MULTISPECIES: PadR family transcriptional regulator [Micromonospora]|uniref:PadR family transcriptional regulator n=1 Tax=Micromonospora solifontis TaxID=2487138 RepID=A0ABX9WGR8_9ACTN|nr:MULTISPECIES: PadR family transcriptional regulator [Micromonospora]NES13937.1 helix-turn-helix transcriptional regulator [Micromonospora sp. PPF5-17B]NES37504.1 helix-turn-helix transcriptional regulator [Micromonospora solifontis]NES54037.1 helix-turn-helix transcriptional regulator [Micromonospora sp. PPF5-6]RNL98310.1 PadR family transcriptional regulator [Micromonospora solifontis]
MSILGFLGEGPLHGYELKVRIARLAGYARPVSDGSLYPAINRLERAGLVSRQQEPGAAAAPRHTLSLTDAGRAELSRRLREPADLDVTDQNRFFTLLAFLGQLDDPAAQATVLERRLAFLDQPASFFHTGERPQRAAEQTDLFRRGMLVMARDISRAERSWLRSAIAELRAG